MLDPGHITMIDVEHTVAVEKEGRAAVGHGCIF
jgi:hypothetical protein